MSEAAPAPAPPPLRRTSRAAPSPVAAAKKHHVCPVCDRGFSSTGHLARHARVHTGERNHKCPFPGCETRCSRQDNLQQHYRIHLSPGGRRKSGRSVLRSKSTPAPSTPAAASPCASDDVTVPSYREESPPLEPPPLEDSRLYFLNDSPPNTPPPLVEATYHQVLTHRELPQIDTSPDGYWYAQQQRHSDMSPASETYHTPLSAYQSPVAPQAYYAHSAATSPAMSPVVDATHPSSYGSSLSACGSYSSLESTDGYAAYEQPRMLHARPPRAYPQALPRRSSGSPTVGPVARGLATRHSIAHIASHAHAQPQSHPHPQPHPYPQPQMHSQPPQHLHPHPHPHPHPSAHSPPYIDSPSPTSSHRSPQTPYTEPSATYAPTHEESYASAHDDGYAPVHAPVEYPAYTYDAPGYSVSHVHAFSEPLEAPYPHPHVYRPEAKRYVPSPAPVRESYPQYMQAHNPYPGPAPTPAHDVYPASPLPPPPPPAPYLYHPQPLATAHLAGYEWKLAAAGVTVPP
ncbi:hypothetical protein DFH09DRAFT_1427563 [Mycena vulgaris]|nr:hypothetical protein DFH09DRAFT_1427563 [Mycena vulgaris]